jgi:hypothetical protein
MYMYIIKCIHMYFYVYTYSAIGVTQVRCREMGRDEGGRERGGMGEGDRQRMEGWRETAARERERGTDRKREGERYREMTSMRLRLRVCG